MGKQENNPNEGMNNVRGQAEAGNPQATGTANEKKGFFGKIGTAGKIVITLLLTTVAVGVGVVVKTVLNKDDEDGESAESPEGGEPAEE